MSKTGLMLFIVVFVAVSYSAVNCAPYPGDSEDLAKRPFHQLQKLPAAPIKSKGSPTGGGSKDKGLSGGKNKGSVGGGTQFHNIDLGNFGSNTNFRVSGLSNVRFSSNFQSSSGGGRIDTDLKDVCASCPSSANACQIVSESQGKQLHTTTKCMNGSKVISEKTKTSPNPSGAQIRSTRFKSVTSQTFNG